MGVSALLVSLTATLFAPGQVISAAELKAQNELYQQWWGTELERRFDELPTKSTVPEWRELYSGHIYPDRAGGTAHVLTKYDRAFNGSYRATAHERWDVSAYRGETTQVVRGLFGFTRTVRSHGIPAWHGHCNGWAAATIRHAEPQYSVRRNGVVFSPADIKGLLAEVYIFNDPDYLCGLDYAMNPGMFHLAMTNWMGRASYPLAMEADPGRERWNFPISSYAYSSRRISDRSLSVTMNVDYLYYSNGEYQQSPKYVRRKAFYYQLDLDNEDKIVGGWFYRGSSMIDLLWVPRNLRPGGKPGNERGNPHIDVDEVLAIWRDSVPKELRDKWINIDPDKAELEIDRDQVAGLMLPVGYEPPTETPAEPAPAETSVATTGEEDAADATETAEPSEAAVAAADETDAVATVGVEDADGIESEPSADDAQSAAAEPASEATAN